MTAFMGIGNTPGVPVKESTLCLPEGSVPPSICTSTKGSSVFDEGFRKEATSIEELEDLCFKELVPKAAPFEEAVVGSGTSVAEVSCASSSCSASGNLSDGGTGCVIASSAVRNSNGIDPNTAATPTAAVSPTCAAERGLSDQINTKLLKRTVSRHGRSSQRWAADPLSHSAIRLTTGCVPIVKGGKVLFVSASNKPAWIFPKGGWENDERMEESALRECFEEAGVIGVLGPKLSELTYETRKARKRRLESEEMLLKRKREKADAMASISKEENTNDDTTNGDTWQALNAPTNAEAQEPPLASTLSSAPAEITNNSQVLVDTTALKEPPIVRRGPGAFIHAPVSDEAFARIRGEMMKKKGKRHLDETSSIQSDASTYNHVRMCLFPLYVTSVKGKWPESGRLRRAVPIDEAIEILSTRPELQAALKEVKDKNLHLLDRERKSVLE